MIMPVTLACERNKPVFLLKNRFLLLICLVLAPAVQGAWKSLGAILQTLLSQLNVVRVNVCSADLGLAGITYLRTYGIPFQLA
jgi:hypothetical protein